MTQSQYRQRQAQLLTGYGAIRLHREGDHAIVSVEARPGKWVEVIRELADGNFSHIVEPIGIEEVFKREGIDPTKSHEAGRNATPWSL